MSDINLIKKLTLISIFEKHLPNQCNKFMFDTPILIIAYKRKDTFLKLLNYIKELNPKKLYIAIDSPPDWNLIDKQQNEDVKKVINDFKYPDGCQVFKLFQDVNLGCGKGPKKAIDWFFSNEDKGIILEDDCLPDKTFFYFCKELLLRYVNDEKIMAISGNNYLLNKIEISESYFFTKYPNIWGWATWRRAWDLMDWEMKDYNNFLKNEVIAKYANTKEEYIYWKKTFDYVHNSLDNSTCWDYQWLYSIWNNNGYGIAPSVNLVKNVGFDEFATHTHDRPIWYNQITNGSIEFITHPNKKLVNQEADNVFFNNTIKTESKSTGFLKKIRNKLTAIFRSIFPKKIKWQDNEYFDPIWKMRIKHMSKYLDTNDKVVDLGCGMMWLTEYLSSTNEYIPVDYKKRGDNTIVCDFNKQQFPDIYADVYFVSGCLEYIEKPLWFIEKISTYSERCIVSYCTIEMFPNINMRNDLMWKNHLSETDLIEYFNKYGYLLKEKTITDTNNQIFYFSK